MSEVADASEGRGKRGGGLITVAEGLLEDIRSVSFQKALQLHRHDDSLLLRPGGGEGGGPYQ